MIYLIAVMQNALVLSLGVTGHDKTNVAKLVNLGGDASVHCTLLATLIKVRMIFKVF